MRRSELPVNRSVTVRLSTGGELVVQHLGDRVQVHHVEPRLPTRLAVLPRATNVVDLVEVEQ